MTKMRKCLSVIARIVLVFLLGTQAVLAASPCVSAEATAADAFVPMPEGCDKAAQSNLCLQHCLNADQSSAHAEMPVFHAPAVPLLILPLPLEAQVPVASPAEAVPGDAAGPPIPIRLQTLLL